MINPYVRNIIPYVRNNYPVHNIILYLKILFRTYAILFRTFAIIILYVRINYPVRTDRTYATIIPSESNDNSVRMAYSLGLSYLLSPKHANFAPKKKNITRMYAIIISYRNIIPYVHNTYPVRTQ